MNKSFLSHNAPYLYQLIKEEPEPFENYLINQSIFIKNFNIYLILFIYTQIQTVNNTMLTEVRNNIFLYSLIQLIF